MKAAEETLADDFPLDWGCRLVERQAEFARAGRVLEIGGGNFARTIALALRYPKKQFISIDPQPGAGSERNISRAAGLSNVSFVRTSATDPFFADEMFDFAFSIAVMEHIAQPELLFSNLYRWLKPRGAYCYFQAPFWTCKKGHHFNHDDPSIQRILNGYEHIRLKPKEMRAFLATFDELPFEANECVRKIYERPDLSRLSPTESLRTVRASGFLLDTWELREDQDFDAEKALEAMRVHAERYLPDDFRFDAVFASLVKP